MNERIEEPVISGREVAKYISELTPMKLRDDVVALRHDIIQLASMMGECMKQSMPAVVVGHVTVHVEMKMYDDVLFSSEMGHTAKPVEEEQG